MSGLSDKIQAAHDGSDVAESAIIDQIKNAHEATKAELGGLPRTGSRARHVAGFLRP